MLTFVRSVCVRFHPFNASNGTARQFLAQCTSPAYFKKFPGVEVKCVVDYDSNIDPSIEIVYGACVCFLFLSSWLLTGGEWAENNAKTVINAKGLSMRDLMAGS